MTTAEFKKVARLLKETYAELEREALADGIDIFSDEYLKVRDIVRLKVLERIGFTLDEYREAKELVAPAKKVDVAKDLLEASTIAQDVSNRVEALNIPNEEDILAKAKEIAEAVVKTPIIQNNVVERTTKVVEKPTYIHTKETINKETDLNPIYSEIGYLNDRLDNLPEIPESYDPKELLDQMRSEFSENLEKNINALGMPDFRKLAMGLQAQIDAISTTPGGAAAWGDITGTLSAQTDLQAALDAKANTVKDTFGITVDGGGTALTTGTKGYRYIEQNCTITGWDVRSDVSGNIVFDVKRSGVSIAGTEKPTLSGASSAQDLTLTTWTVSLSAGDIIEFIIDSTATLTRATLSVLVTKT